MSWFVYRRGEHFLGGLWDEFEGNSNFVNMIHDIKRCILRAFKIGLSVNMFVITRSLTSLFRRWNLSTTCLVRE